MKWQLCSRCHSPGYTLALEGAQPNTCRATALASTGVSAARISSTGSTVSAETDMHLDIAAKLADDARTGGRITERKIMIRRRFQNGCLTIKGKGQKMWVARWRETVLQPDNTLSKVLRSKVLGPVSQISKSEARTLLANCLRSRNLKQKRPLTTITFERLSVRNGSLSP